MEAWAEAGGPVKTSVVWLGFKHRRAMERAERLNAAAARAAAGIPRAPRIRSFAVERRWLVLWSVKKYERERTWA